MTFFFCLLFKKCKNILKQQQIYHISRDGIKVVTNKLTNSNYYWTKSQRKKKSFLLNWKSFLCFSFFSLNFIWNFVVYVDFFYIPILSFSTNIKILFVVFKFCMNFTFISPFFGKQIMQNNKNKVWGFFLSLSLSLS